MKSTKRLSNLELMRLEKRRIIARSQWKRRWHNILDSLLHLSKNLSIISLITIVSVGSFFFYRWNGGLLLKEIIIYGKGNFDSQQIINQSGLEYGQAMEEISLEEIKSRISQIQEIDQNTLEVKRRFPNKIEISFQSRKAIAIDEATGHWILQNGVFSQNLNQRKNFPLFSCPNRQIQTRLITFLDELQTHDQNAYRDISRVSCDEHGFANVEFNSNPANLILNPSGKPLLGFIRFMDALQKYPEELRKFRRFDLVNEGFLFAS